MGSIKIIHIENEPIEHIEYLTIPQGQIEAQSFQLPIYMGYVQGLSQQIDSLVVTSDLQGICRTVIDDQLLGVTLAEFLPLIYELYFPQLKMSRSIAFLCGDLYTNLDKRGASGNPILVWQAFAEQFQQVIGIAGNHDVFGQDLEKINQIERVTFIENGIVNIYGIKIAGLSGIIGRADKNFRMSEIEYSQALKKLLKQVPDLLLTHISPQIVKKQFQGEIILTDHLLKASPITSFCGHSHWDTHDIYQMENGTQILNADSKVFILLNKNK